MLNEALRILVADDYVTSIGRAVYAYAYLEWQIVCIGREIDPAFGVRSRNWTGGKIAKKFAIRAANSPHATELEPIADNFVAIVPRRDALLHGTPYTKQPDGEQRLLYTGRRGTEDWSRELIDALADDCAVLAIKANSFFYSRLRP